MTPLIQAIAEDGSSHLFGTHGPYRTVVLVEFEAGLFERQAAIVQQTPNLAFGVCDQVLVNDAVDASWQYFVEVSHQLDIVAVIEAKIGKAIGECVAPREVLFERGKARSHGMASRVDDPSVRQDEVDQKPAGAQRRVNRITAKEGIWESEKV
jgi:hypothetical protein